MKERGRCSFCENIKFSKNLITCPACGLEILGNEHFIPKKELFERFKEWEKNTDTQKGDLW